MPLFLYGSGFLKDRIFSATCPTCCRSTPLTTSFVCLSTVMLIPGGIGYSIGWEKPSVKTTELFLASARNPTPTISNSFLNPSVTPLTAFATRARARPWKALCGPLSSLRTASTCLSFCSNVIPGGIGFVTDPLGPVTTTLSALISTFTLSGRGIGFLPIRDILHFLNKCCKAVRRRNPAGAPACRSEEHTSELQSPCNLVCRLLLEKKKKKKYRVSIVKKTKKNTRNNYR